MLVNLLPAACSRLRIFLCHAHADRATAEEIAQALKNDGHTVFFDKDSLPAAADYNEQIRKAIRAADRFIFLISRSSLAEGKFTLSELTFAKERWPNAEGYILPVLIDRSAEIAQVPAYLRSVHILQVEGNAPAEVAAAIEKSRSVRGGCKALVAFAALAIASAGLAVAAGINPLAPEARFALLMPAQVDFRPMEKPSNRPSWQASDVAVTLIPVQYTHRSGGPIRIHSETVDLRIGAKRFAFQWFNEVSLRVGGCDADWLCIKRTIGAETLETGRTLSRETMFSQHGGQRLKWQELVELVQDTANKSAEVRLQARVESSALLGVRSQSGELVCRVDLDVERAKLERMGVKRGSGPPPTRMTGECLPAR